MRKIAIVAALERELLPLIKHWGVSEHEYSGRKFRFYKDGDAVVVCGGIGPQAARRATEAVLALYGSSCVYSVGYAGALDLSLKVADVIRPVQVIDANDGSSTQIAAGNGVLVSQTVMANVEQKSRLRDAYGAQAVDMEASGVARAAEARGVPFQAIKVISDEFDFELPDSGRFVNTDGRFQQIRFALFLALRPWLWARVVQLARNSARASRALCAELQKMLSEKIPAGSVR